MPNELPTPETRHETFLAAAAGVEVEKPTPITREEMFLDAIAGGGTVDAYTKAETDALLADKADIVDGKVPTDQLPSYVDDVVEYASFSQFPVTGESGKIYLAIDTNTSYRWSGSTYIPITGQADWNQSDTTSPDYIKNKPGITDTATQSSTDLITSGGVYTIVGNINAALEEVL